MRAMAAAESGFSSEPRRPPAGSIQSAIMTDGCLGQAVVRDLEAKEHVFWEGDPRTHVFRVEDGVIAIYKVLPDGRRQVIDFAYSGDFIGLDPVSEHIFNAQATCAAKVRCLPAEALQKAAARDAGFALELFNAASRDLAAARSLIVSIGQGSAVERVASFLMTLHRRARGGGGDGAVVHLSMRRSDIGDLLGLTIETVSRTLTKLRVMDVIDVVHGSEVHIRDLGRLEELTGA